MKIDEIDLSLLSLRILAAFTEYMESRKNEVTNGEKSPDLAALEVKNYGHGLAKALAIAEDMMDVPCVGMLAHVDRRVLEIQPCVLDKI